MADYESDIEAAVNRASSELTEREALALATCNECMTLRSASGACAC